MTKQTPPDAADLAAANPSAADPAADAAAQAAGFANAQAKADLENAAAKARPRRPRSPSKPKSRGFSVKAPTLADFEVLRVAAAQGSSAQLVLADGRKAIEGVRPALAAMMIRRGRPCNAVAVAFVGAGLERPVEATHVFALAPDAKPGAQPDAIAELAAPVVLRPGEQFRLDAGGIAFFPPAAAA
ncbi:MAG: hypothetical protein ACK4IS_13315 [Erythrobacter sp.]